MAIGNPVSNTSSSVASKTSSVIATAGQTLFTVSGGYVTNHISVFRNGIRLVDSRDYEARNGATVTLLAAATVGDVIEFHVFDTFSVADAVTNQGGTIFGDLTVEGSIGDITANNVTGVAATFTGAVSVGGVLTYEDVTNIDSVGIITARNAIVISEDNAIHFRGTAADDADAILRASAGGGQLLINSRNDAIINIDSNNDTTDAHFAIAHGAATGSSTELFRVQEDGKVLIGATSGGGLFSVHQATSSTSNYINITNDATGSSSWANGMLIGVNADGDALVWQNESRSLRFGTGNADKMRIDSSGRLLLGTTTEGYSTSDDLTIATSGHTGMTIRSGTSNYGSIHFSDGTSGNAEYRGVIEYSHANDSLALYTAASAHLTLDSSGNMGLGTNNPTSNGGTTLEIYNTTTPTLKLNDGGDYKALFQLRGNDLEIRGSNGAMEFYTGNADGASSTERLRIDSSGKVLINHTADTAPAGYASKFQLCDTSYQGSSMLLRRDENSASAPALLFAKTRSGSKGGSTVVQDDDITGQIMFFAGDGTDANSQTAFIQSAVDGSPAANDMPGRLTFHTTADGATASTERMRISQDGNVQISMGGSGYATLFRYGTNEDNYIRSGANGFTVFGDHNGGERMRIDSSGHMGLGTNSPAKQLHISDTTGDAQIRITGSGGSSDIYANSNIYFQPNGTTRVTMDSSGRLLVGTTAQSLTAMFVVQGQTTNTSLGGYMRLQTGSSVTDDHALGTISFGDASNNGANIQARGDMSWSPFGKGSNLRFSTTGQSQTGPQERMRIDSSGRLLVQSSSAPTQGIYAQYAPLTVQGYIGAATGNGIINIARGATAAGLSNNTDIGTLVFSDSAGGEFARISCFVDAAPGSNDYPGRLTFHTTANGASAPTERMKINQLGQFFASGVYNATTSNAANVYVFADGLLARSTSSIKYKTEIETLQDSYADNILNCRPVWYRSSSSLDNTDWGYWGFIAEEVAEIDPRLVNWKTTDITYDGNGSTVETPCDPEPEGVQYDRFVPHLLNLIKRQQAAIETLETKVAALEG